MRNKINRALRIMNKNISETFLFHKQFDHKHQHTANDRYREKPCIPAQNTLRQGCAAVFLSL